MRLDRQQMELRVCFSLRMFDAGQPSNRVFRWRAAALLTAGGLVLTLIRMPVKSRKIGLANGIELRICDLRELEIAELVERN